MNLEAEVADLEQRFRAMEEQRNTLQIPVRVADAQGRVLLSIDLDEEGSLRLELFNDQGNPSIVLAVPRTEAPFLQVGPASIFHGDGRLYISDGGCSACTITAQGNEASIVLATPPEGGGRLELLADTDGSHLSLLSQGDVPQRIDLLARRDEGGVQVCMGSDGEAPGVRVASDPEVGGMLEVRSAAGEAIFSAQAPEVL